MMKIIIILFGVFGPRGMLLLLNAPFVTSCYDSLSPVVLFLLIFQLRT